MERGYCSSLRELMKGDERESAKRGWGLRESPPRACCRWPFVFVCSRNEYEGFRRTLAGEENKKRMKELQGVSFVHVSFVCWRRE